MLRCGGAVRYFATGDIPKLLLGVLKHRCEGLHKRVQFVLHRGGKRGVGLQRRGDVAMPDARRYGLDVGPCGDQRRDVALAHPVRREALDSRLAPGGQRSGARGRD